MFCYDLNILFFVSTINFHFLIFIKNNKHEITRLLQQPPRDSLPTCANQRTRSGSGEQAASGGANGTNGASTNSRDEMDLAEKIRRLVDSNPGKSISVLLNPENSSTSHIRIDDKFF